MSEETEYLSQAELIAAFSGLGFKASRGCGGIGVELGIKGQENASEPAYLFADEFDEDSGRFFVCLYLDGVNGDLMVEGSLEECQRWLRNFDADEAVREWTTYHAATVALG